MTNLKDSLLPQTKLLRPKTNSLTTSTLDNNTTLTPFNLCRIFHPTDCSAESTLAFIHALKIAQATGAELSIFHREQSREKKILPTLNDSPHVRTTLTEWGKQFSASEKSQDEKNGFSVEKILAMPSNAKNETRQYYRDNSTDLIVLTTHQHHGFCFFSSYRTAEAITSTYGVMTLVVPSGCQGFVSPLDRTVTLNRILIPISSTPDPQTAIDATSAMAQILGNPEGVFTLLHIGCEQDMPNIELPDHPGWTWKTTIKTGKVVDEVLFEDAEQSFNLIVMTTRGHQHFLEAILETTTESVMQQARCPILVLPTLSPS